MARIFITGSADGLGRAAAETLLGQGHEVFLHARSPERAAALGPTPRPAAGVFVGDLARAIETAGVAAQANAVGRMDAVIHNAGVYSEPERGSTPEGHARTVAINLLAPYLLTATMMRPGRLIYISSGLHRDGTSTLGDLDWTQRPWDGATAYAETKLQVVALVRWLARKWPDVVSSAVDPGWVRTRMGGPSAPVDLETGQATQSWLAVSADREALVSGQYWRHRQPETPADQARDPAFQDGLIAALQALTGTAMPTGRG